MISANFSRLLVVIWFYLEPYSFQIEGSKFPPAITSFPDLESNMAAPIALHLEFGLV